MRRRLAILGGGQLGRMLGLAAIPLDIDCSFLDPSPEAPAAAAGRLVVGPLDDREALLDTATGADAVTYEWEGVPAGVARLLAEAGHRVDPGARALEVSQDRWSEKSTFSELGIEIPACAPVATRAELRDAAAQIGLPAVLKTRRGGYDGKGQVVIEHGDDLGSAWSELGSADGGLVLEERIAFDRELSIIAVRGRDGEIRSWPLVENHHSGGILRLSRAPAPEVSAGLRARAEAHVTALLQHFDYVGVLALELFQVGDRLLANEMAPRVHNSGHWTIEGADTSQFENHVRAVLDLPLGSTAARGVSAMRNCIGEPPDPARVLSVPGAHLHLYGKTPRPGRKLGHITVTARDLDDLEASLAQLRG
jgi:5-(carboxyamino)imidazole ribonucleotide synthase